MKCPPIVQVGLGVLVSSLLVILIGAAVNAVIQADRAQNALPKRALLDGEFVVPVSVMTRTHYVSGDVVLVRLKNNTFTYCRRDELRAVEP